MTLKFGYNLIFRIAFISVYVYTTHVCVPMNARRWCQIPWIYSYKWLSDVGAGNQTSPTVRTAWSLHCSTIYPSL